MTATQGKTLPLRLCISSGKGGVGKTTLAVNLAAALAGLTTEPILLIDGDLGLANVDVMLGLSCKQTIQETLCQNRDPAELLLATAAGFQVLPAGSGVPELATPDHSQQQVLYTAISQLARRFAAVIIDCAAGIGDSVQWFNSWASLPVVVLTPDPTALTDAYALIKVLHQRQRLNRFALLLNNVKSQRQGQQVFGHMEKICTTFLGLSPLYLGSVPSDRAVVQAIRNRRPVLKSAPSCRASTAIGKIAAAIFQNHWQPDNTAFFSE